MLETCSTASSSVASAQKWPKWPYLRRTDCTLIIYALSESGLEILGKNLKSNGRQSKQVDIMFAGLNDLHQYDPMSNIWRSFALNASSVSNNDIKSYLPWVMLIELCNVLWCKFNWAKIAGISSNISFVSWFWIRSLFGIGVCVYANASKLQFLSRQNHSRIAPNPCYYAEWAPVNDFLVLFGGKNGTYQNISRCNIARTEDRSILNDLTFIPNFDRQSSL